jgi:hypothetical protein
VVFVSLWDINHQFLFTKSPDHRGKKAYDFPPIFPSDFVCPTPQNIIFLPLISELLWQKKLSTIVRKYERVFPLFTTTFVLVLASNSTGAGSPGCSA